MFHDSDPWYHCVAVSLPSTGGLSRIVWQLQTPHTPSPESRWSQLSQTDKWCFPMACPASPAPRARPAATAPRAPHRPGHGFLKALTAHRPTLAPGGRQIKSWNCPNHRKPRHPQIHLMSFRHQGRPEILRIGPENNILDIISKVF